jgi:hypothetical protein
MMDSCPSILNTSPADLEQYWLEQIKLKQASGLSRAAYCRKHNLVCSRFAYWENKLSKPITQLLPVTLNPASVKADTLCTLRFKSGNELKIHDSAILPTLLSLLG